MFGADAQRILDAYLAHLERIEQQRREEIAAIQAQIAVMEKDVQARILRAQGMDAEADALSREIERTKEVAAAREAGAKALIPLLRELYALEDAAFAAAEAAAAAARAFNESQINLDLDARDAALQGDTAGEAEARARARADEERRTAQEMFDAGEISAATFREWIRIINEEYIQAIEDAAEATREAAKAAEEAARAEQFRAMVDMENLHIRLAVAQGMDAEAQAMRNQLEILTAIEEGRSAEYIALLRQIHAQEAINRSRQQETRAVHETTRAINGMVRALNAPAGLPLQLLRYETIDRRGGGGQTPGPFGGGSSTLTVQAGAIVVHAAAGQDPKAVAREVMHEFERAGRAGNPVVFGEA
jgi:hypothetical protein